VEEDGEEFVHGLDPSGRDRPAVPQGVRLVGLRRFRKDLDQSLVEVRLTQGSWPIRVSARMSPVGTVAHVCGGDEVAGQSGS
jgi:hypothetical protein